MELQFIRTEFSKTDMACASNGSIQTIKRHKELSISLYSYNILSEKSLKESKHKNTNYFNQWTEK